MMITEDQFTQILEDVETLAEQDMDHVRFLEHKARNGHNGSTPKPPEERETQLKNPLSNRHKEVLRLVNMGFTNKQIGEILKYTSAAISNIKNSLRAQGYLSKLEMARNASATDINNRMSAIAPQALDILEQTLTEEGVPVVERNRTARDLLDRAGFAPTHRVEVGRHLAVEDIEAIKTRALEQCKRAGLLIETEVEDAETVETEAGG